jgi:hypothetical protein
MVSARRLRASHPALLRTGLTVTCEQCGQQFGIAHDPAPEALAVATRQAKWLADRFVWDHIQETRHKGSIPLPAV